MMTNWNSQIASCDGRGERLRHFPFLAILLAAGMVTFHAGADESSGTDEAAPATDTSAIRFTTLDVIIDTGDATLAAYQFDFRATRGDVKIVGLEGGEHEAYKDAPYYDPAAMRNDRVIVAAYSTANDLPQGQTRVARIHVQIEGATAPEYKTQLVTAAGINGEPMDASITIAEGGNQ